MSYQYQLRAAEVVSRLFEDPKALKYLEALLEHALNPVADPKHLGGAIIKMMEDRREQYEEDDRIDAEENKNHYGSDL